MTPMKWIELEDYTLPVSEEGSGIQRFSFSVSKGDICWLDADVTEDAHLFFKALATLVTPLSGNYRFEGECLDFTKPDTILRVKKTIGYITTHSALIRNRSLRENLTLMRSYADKGDRSHALQAFKRCQQTLLDELDVEPEAATTELREQIAAGESRPPDFFVKP